MAWCAPAKLRLKGDVNESADSPWRYFVQGLTNNLANPKMIAFFLALFPQFVQPDRGSLTMQSLVLGMTLAIMAAVWIGCMVTLIGRFRMAVAENTTFLKVANRLAAITFFGLACRLAIKKRP